MKLADEPRENFASSSSSSSSSSSPCAVPSPTNANEKPTTSCFCRQRNKCGQQTNHQSSHQNASARTFILSAGAPRNNFSEQSRVRRRPEEECLSKLISQFGQQHSVCDTKVINSKYSKFNKSKLKPIHWTRHSLVGREFLLAVSLIVIIAIEQVCAFQTADGQSTSACFGGLQTFEKISMSSFEPSPILTSAGTSAAPNNQQQQFSQAGGILVQQDDQALTSECVNLCKSQSNCLSFVIDYNKFECKSYAVTQQQLQQQSAANHDESLMKRSSNVTIEAADNIAPSESSTNQQQQQQQQQRLLLPSASANYFEKICLAGVATRQEFVQVCGQDRLWAVERVVDAFLDGFTEKEITNVNSKDECSKLCLFENQFVCRSADYDQNNRLCRLSKEDRRTQPQAFRTNLKELAGRHYIENQCATPGPSSCVYELKRNVGVVSMDALKYAQNVNDCQMKCSQEQTFNCRSYSYHNNRCFLSGDDSVSLSSLVKLPVKQNWQFGERKCVVELCTKGIFTYEKTSGFILRSALSTTIDLLASSSATSMAYRMTSPHLDQPTTDSESMSTAEANTNRLLRRNYQPSDEPELLLMNEARHESSTLDDMGLLTEQQEELSASSSDRRQQQHQHHHHRPHSSHNRAHGSLHHQSNNLAITGNCRQACDSGYLNCPSFTIDYKNNRCQRLDRNSQGRHQDLVARDGHSYFEKICLRVPEIMSMCQDKYWIFERVLGYELAPHLYDKTLKFVLSRRDCEEYCLEERQFQCRSALYNDETSDCKLSHTDRRLLVAGQDGYYRNFNAKVSYLENQCIRNHQLERHHQCRYEQPKNEPSYPTFTEIIEPAAITASGTNSSSAAISADLVQQHGVAYCEQLCNDNAQFECHSFGYYSSTNQCFLSGDDMVSVGESAVTLSPGFVYYEKKCHTPTSTRSNGTTTQGTPTVTTVTNGSGDTTFTTVPLISATSPAILPPGTTSATNGLSSTNPATNQPNLQNEPPPNQPLDQQPTTTTTRIPPHVPHVIPLSTGGAGVSGSGSQQQTNINININPLMTNVNRPITTTTTTTSPAGTPSDTITENQSGPDDTSTRSSTTLSDSTQTIGAADLDADTYKCGQGNVFTYQRIAGFEPIGGFLTLLLHDNQQAGIVDECAQLCKRAYECRAFVVDYTQNQCFAMLENSSIGQLSLRQSLGRDYFEGFCLGQQHLYVGTGLGQHTCANKTWISDRIVDQAVVGVQAQQVLEQSDRARCRLACFEQRLFYCKSAMFDAQTRECRLYAIDRESTLHMSLLFTKGVDFFENQCQLTATQCPYDAIERDITIVSATKSVQGHSTFDCEQACNEEQTFNCRSYTYLHNYPDQLPNVCILSADSRSTSQKGSIRERKRTLYAERNCFNRKPRRPGSSSSSSGSSDPGLIGVSSSASIPPPPSPIAYGSTFTQPITKPAVMDPQPSLYNTAMVPQNNNNPSNPFKPIVFNDQTSTSIETQQQQPGGTICEPHQYTFERTFGYDFRFARRERAPVLQSLGVVVACQQECLLREDKCQAFVVEYALPYQGCFLLDSSVGANKKLLTRATNMAYFEKICIVRTGINNDLALQMQHGQLSPQYQLETSGLVQASPESIIGGEQHNQQQLTADNQWPQSANQLPYYMQQQRLVQQYPSRACARLWSFERFLNSNFTLAPERLITNVLSRLLCEQYCINEARFNCRSATYDYNNLTCRLFKETRRSTLSQFVTLADVQNPAKIARQLLGNGQEQQTSSANIDYLENQCVQQPSSCQYRPIYDSFSPFIDKIVSSVSLSDCQRQCDSEQLFKCRAINYDPTNKECMLLNEDLVTLDRGQQSLIARKNIIYSEKGNCELVSVQCNPQEMLVSINFDSPFRGRILANGNPEQCFIIGDGQTTIHFPIVFGPKCNSRQEGHNTFVNEVVIQQHPVIMTDSDKTVRVMCSFEAPDQTITLKNPTTNGAGKAGIDVSNNPENSRTRHDRPPFNSVISNKSSPPMVILRILDLNDRDATMINLGDDLVLKIQMQPGDQGQQQASALSIFARNLRARSSNGESLLLIDNDGCPVDNAVFPALSIDPKDGKSLYSTFKAFRFPSSGLVNFEVQIRFCPERCQPVQCNRGQLQSYGRRRRRRRKREAPVTPANVFSLSESPEMMMNNSDETVTQFIETVNPSTEHQNESNQSSSNASSLLVMASSQNESHQNSPIGTLQTISDAGEIMKPGRAFQMLREMLLSDSQPFYSQTTNTTNGGSADTDRGSHLIDSATTNSSNNSNNINDSTRTLSTIDNNNDNTNNNNNTLPNRLMDANDFSGKSKTETGEELPPLSSTPIVPNEEFYVTTSGANAMSEFVLNDSTNGNKRNNFAEENSSTQSEITTAATPKTDTESHPTRQISETGTDRAKLTDETDLDTGNNKQLSADYQSVVPPPILTHISERIVPNYLGRPVSFSSHSQPNLIQTHQLAVTEPRLRLDASRSQSIDFDVISDRRFSPHLSPGQMIPDMLHHQQTHQPQPITTSVISNSYPVHSVEAANQNYPTIQEPSLGINVDYSSTRWKYQQGQTGQFEPTTTSQPSTTEIPFTTTLASVQKNIAAEYPAPYDHQQGTNEAHQSTRQQLPRTNSRASATEVPLKFSILVGDQNHHHNRIGSAIGSANWPTTHGEDLSTATEDGLSIKNIANHQYGRDGSIAPGQTHSVNDFEPSSRPFERPPVLSNTEMKVQSTINNTHSFNPDRPIVSNVDSNVTALSSGSQDNNVDTNTNENNFDIVPHDNSLDPLLPQPTNNRSSVTTTIQSQAELAHADCPIDNASSRLWLIVWTGTIVIVLNVGLVVISLIIYFKKIHLSGRHKVKSIHRSHGGIGKKSNGSRKHLSTSLEASEHFFAKLNGQSRATTRSSSIKPVQSTQRNHINQSTGEFQWPNLSSSSSHSTISSITCPPPLATTSKMPRTNNRNGHLLQHHDLGHLQQIVTQRSGAPIYQSEFYNINEIDNDDDEDDNIITCTVNHGFEHDDDDSTKQYSNNKNQNRPMEPSTSFDNLKNYVAVPCGNSNKTKDCDMTQSNCHLMSKRFLNEDDQYTSNTSNKNDAMW